MNAPEAGLPVPFKLHGLVSLWDMLRLKGDRFSLALIEISHIYSQLLYLSKKGDIGERQGSELNKHNRKALAGSLESFIETVSTLEVDAAKEGAVFLLRKIKSKEAIGLSTVVFSIEQIIFSFRDQMASREAYFLTDHEASILAEGANLFGCEVQLRFPSITAEISDCAKSYAFEQHTGCAFHALRCLESGIRAMARCLGIPDPTRGVDRSWAIVLRAIKGEMDRRWPNSGDRMGGDGHVFEDLYAALASMQNPWRNATMHLETRYSRDEAESLIHVVRRFMSRLAERMDEDGLPKA